MFIIFCLISFNYNLVRAAKDTIIVTTSGAETIPFLKVWAMLPMAIFLTYVLSKLSNKFGREKVFYLMIGLFLVFYFIFTFFLYPIRDVLHPIQTTDMLATLLPAGFKGFLAIFRNWTLTAFYVMSELWGTIVLSVLFWGFANEVSTVQEAKRFYALLGVGANIAAALSGEATVLFSKIPYNPHIHFGTNAWEQSFMLINLTVILVGLLIMLIFKLFHTKVLHKDTNFHENQSPPAFKMSLLKNFSCIAKSRYLIYIAIIVITYNVAINLFEVVWKNQVNQLYPNPSDFNAYMGKITMIMSIIATVTALFISGKNILKRFSWTFSALITPLIMFITGVGFFVTALALNNSTLIAVATFVGMTPLVLNVFFGSIQECFSRACKYTLFDATKEIAFIPLDKESKRKGKTAIDGIGSRIGKSSGSLIHQSLILTFSSLAFSAPYIATIFFIVVFSWFFSVTALGKQFNVMASHKEPLPVPETALQETKNA